MKALFPSEEKGHDDDDDENDKCLLCWNWKFNKDLARNPARVVPKTINAIQAEFRTGKKFILLFWWPLLNKRSVDVLKFDHGHQKLVAY